jgi:hypothetical protein
MQWLKKGQKEKQLSTKHCTENFRVNRTKKVSSSCLITGTRCVSLCANPFN